ncbi:hypothetical protein G6321_00050060 [Bradyrhizobium barranii subsp. barranii]|uniref:Uncharacterized protein n=1 Tax=Bradyrhizobium barranii subsp. barranii TaxID=2823807 RepID=A0A7Z0QAT0_9BRAD|nr:hypothetical protein [Bradyrhizobium barranii]UGX93646.1 hypothetical protein G6321_00050060 [Bradyrhizobium barranii subsp. barranii]
MPVICPLVAIERPLSSALELRLNVEPEVREGQSFTSSQIFKTLMATSIDKNGFKTFHLHRQSCKMTVISEEQLDCSGSILGAMGAEPAQG